MKYTRTYSSNVYYDRASRQVFLVRELSAYLRSTIIDIGGGGRKRLAKALGKGISCIEVDVFGNPDIKADLEKDLPLKIENNAFETVVCLEVLEHVENPSEVIKECMRIGSSYLIVSLPNPVREIFAYLQARFKKVSDPDRALRVGVYSKFYGLPPLPPTDRHKWFFTYADAEKFMEYHAVKNEWIIEEYFAIGSTSPHFILKLLFFLIPEHLKRLLLPQSYWFVLRKKI
jgi:hypothetical protein